LGSRRCGAASLSRRKRRRELYQTAESPARHVWTPGGDGVKTPGAGTADQTEIALFWYERDRHSGNYLAGRRLS